MMACQVPARQAGVNPMATTPARRQCSGCSPLATHLQRARQQAEGGVGVLDAAGKAAEDLHQHQHCGALPQLSDGASMGFDAMEKRRGETSSAPRTAVGPQAHWAVVYHDQPNCPVAACTVSTGASQVQPLVLLQYNVGNRAPRCARWRCSPDGPNCPPPLPSDPAARTAPLIRNHTPSTTHGSIGSGVVATRLTSGPALSSAPLIHTR